MKFVAVKSREPLEKAGLKGTADDAVGLPAVLPGIDVAAGLMLLRGKKAFFKKLLLNFYEDYREAAEKMRNWVIQENYAQMERFAHTVKGIAGTIGAGELRAASNDLEIAARESSEQTEQLVDVFIQKLTVVMSSIETLSKPTGARGAAAESLRRSDIDRAKLAGVLPEFIRLLKTGDVEAEDHFGAVAECFMSSTYEEEIRTVGRHMDDFEYEEAARILEGILEEMKIAGQEGFHA